jgi:hypothetical protein
MSDFDIKTLLSFKPAKYLCLKCRALMVNFPHGLRKKLSCQVCGVEYAPTACKPDFEKLYSYLKKRGCYIETENLFEHAKSLAHIADRLSWGKMEEALGHKPSLCNSPFRVLLEGLSEAKHFIHFTSWNISPLLIGAIKLKSIRTPVCGVVSNVDSNVLPELTDYVNETGNLRVEVFNNDSNWGDMPHTKLIVIDGLLAFKGSANMTTSGWRKAAKGLEIIEVVTNINEVIELNNRYFSPIWSKLSSYGDKIDVTGSNY